ncbi:RNA polymerase sigma factor [Agromyces mangrovi Wang et al. 2018]|uniref:RNA polymerase sigma factor n=1 Tax=Agromyces mangrovi TaxID=1858653 RepID=UPI0025727871|nr:sigma-70 family RNA polymerase sigma factor [Agromyces mangrovi]
MYIANAADLLNFFGRRVEVPADASDLLSETFLVATRRRSRLPDDETEARMWLFGVARNVLANATRGARRRHRFTAALADHLAALPPEQIGDRALDVRAALTAIPADQAELVRLVLWDGFTVAQAAVIVGVSESTARGRFQRARTSLRARLRDYEPSRRA